MKLCELIDDGMSVHQACQGKSIPHPVTVYRWLAALHARVAKVSEELIEIANRKIDAGAWFLIFAA